MFEPLPECTIVYKEESKYVDQAINSLRVFKMENQPQNSWRRCQREGKTTAWFGISPSSLLIPA